MYSCCGAEGGGELEGLRLSLAPLRVGWQVEELSESSLEGESGREVFRRLTGREVGAGSLDGLVLVESQGSFRAMGKEDLSGVGLMVLLWE